MSKHHIAQELVRRGNQVIFLDPPVMEATTMRVRQEGDVVVAQYKHWLRGVNKLPRAVHMWYYERLIREVAQHTGGPFDVLWCFDMSRMQWFPKKMGFRLLYLADFDILHQGEGLIRTADVIFATSQVVKDHVEATMDLPVINVGHALDQRWLQGIEALHERPLKTPRKVVFAGQLGNSYNDWEGFLDCAKRHPELSFDFIGPYREDLPEPAFHSLKKLPNVQFKGLMSKDDLVPIVRSADILLFGFRSADLSRERANPHKVLEYLSTGNVIVGSWTMEYLDKPGLLCMADQGASLADTLDRALADHQELNSVAARTRRIEHARKRSIGKLLDRVLEQIPASL